MYDIVIWQIEKNDFKQACLTFQQADTEFEN